METRVQIIDFNHQIHTFYHSQHRLSVRVNMGGVVVEKDTTIHNGCIKNLYKWSKSGKYPTAVCFDRAVPARKAYWSGKFPDMTGTNGYKGNREKMPEQMFEAVTDCERILRQAGVSCYAVQNYEADDLIFACIQRAKEKYPGCPIDVVTNDADLLPLVDDTVSVFLRSKTGTFAVSKDLEKAHYVQVTPDNYQDVVERLSAYKGFMIPYNSLLLHKILRGDTSDHFGRKEISKMFPPTKYNAMIAKMLEDGVDFSNTFRYGSTSYKIVYRETGEEFPGSMQEALASPDKDKLVKRISPPEQLTAILELLKKYSKLSDEQLDMVSHIYTGMNLNQDYPARTPEFNRRAYVVGEANDIKPFDEFALQDAVRPLQIRLLKA